MRNSLAAFFLALAWGFASSVVAYGVLRARDWSPTPNLVVESMAWHSPPYVKRAAVALFIGGLITGVAWLVARARAEYVARSLPFVMLIAALASAVTAWRWP